MVAIGDVLGAVESDGAIWHVSNQHLEILLNAHLFKNLIPSHDSTDILSPKRLHNQHLINMMSGRVFYLMIYIVTTK